MEHDFNPARIRLIVGLGNPGPEYEHTYHNAGRLAVEHFAKILGAPAFTSVSKLPIEATRAGTFTLAYPTIFMNESGRAVGAAIKYYKVSPENLLLVHDDADLPLGETRIALGRGDAGHRGVQSVIATLGTDAFPRFRIGIRRELPQGAPRIPAGDFVLSKIYDEATLEPAFRGLEKLLRSPDKE